MCIKLGAKVPAREILEDVYEHWKNLHGKQFYEKLAKGEDMRMDKSVGAKDDQVRPAMA